MNNKTLIALLGIGLIPSLLFGQLYRMDIDAQQAGQERVIDRVFTGNTVGLDVGFYDGATPILMTNWTVMFQYYDGQYSTNSPVQIKGVSSGNRVIFDSTSNVFYSASENYYFSIAGVDAAGRKRTFARGRMIEEYDPGTAGSVGVSSNGLYFVSWANIFGDPGSNSNLVEYVAMHGGEFGSDAVAATIPSTNGLASTQYVHDAMAEFSPPVPTNVVPATKEEATIIWAGGYWSEWGPSVPYEVGRWYNGWNFSSNGVATLGSISFTNEIGKTVLKSTNTIDIGGDFTIRGQRTVRTSDQSMINYVAGAEFNGSNYYYTIGTGWGLGGEWSFSGMTWTNGLFILSTNAEMSTTNTTSRIISELRLAFTNESGVRLGEIGVYINGEQTDILQPYVDGATHEYYLSSYARPGDALSLRWGQYIPPSPSTSAAMPCLVMPVQNISAGLSTNQTLATWGLSDTNGYGNVVDVHGQILFTDTPTAESDGRTAATKDYADAVSDAAREAAVGEIYNRNGDTKINENRLIMGPRWQLYETNETLQLWYSGQLIYEWVGGGIVIPRISFVSSTSTGITLTVVARTSGVYAVDWSTDYASWTRIPTNSIQQTVLDSKTVSLAFAIPSSSSSMAYRVASVVAPTTVAKNRSLAQSTTGTNDVPVATQPWVESYVAEHGGGSTSPVAGTVLYYNVTADSTAVGNYALARTNGTAIGTAAWADTYGAALGDTAYAPRSGAALGADTLATDYGVAVGRGAHAQHTNVAIGAGAQATGKNSASIGAGAVNDMDNTVLLGNTETTQTVARGTLAVGSIALGTSHPTSVWPQGGTTNIFTGAGTTGLVASASGDTNKFLRGDGTWQEVQAGTAGGITSLVVNGYAVPQTNGQAYLNITTSGGVFASNTPGNVELFLSSFPAWAGVGSNRVAFTYVTNAPQLFTVPSGVTNISVFMCGAGAYNAGVGGSSFCTFPVTPEENLEIRVGGKGYSLTKTNDFVPGGWPGGGDGYSKGAALTQSGGGYSGVFRGTNVVVIAAGGGVLAAGGGISGATGSGTPGFGGTQTAGGAAASTNQLAGSFLQGGSATTNATGVGGGGGYFGGGGGIATGSSGGGSGFINTSLGAVGYTFRGQVGTELPEYIAGKGGALQDGLIVIGY